jgi:excisionase family DNA binding protein
MSEQQMLTAREGSPELPTTRPLNLQEAALYLGVHEHTLEAWARSGRVKGAKPGKRWMFQRFDLDQYFDSQRNIKCPSTREAVSGGANGALAARKLEKLLERPTAKGRRNTTTAAVLSFGDHQSSESMPSRSTPQPLHGGKTTRAKSAALRLISCDCDE